ncbi:MAG: c-type cytochrome [Methylocystis sp.]|uniref:c-type cytochrome n=1 Tax=Methylocystis sp. TaxID=1911079 RepID=UPI0039599C46
MRISACLISILLLVPSAKRADAGDVSEVLAQCAACHGVEGIAKSADVPHLAGQQELYLFNQIKAFRSGARPHKEMRYMSRQLSEAEMREIARYYAGMRR